MTINDSGLLFWANLGILRKYNIKNDTACLKNVTNLILNKFNKLKPISTMFCT